MELLKLIDELRSERTAIEQALAVLERLARGQGKRRGRPPAWLSMAKNGTEVEVGIERKKRALSPDARKRMAEAQKKRWAAYRKAQPAG